ncbi:SLBB domain-containing protein [Pseudoalteromonas shioyasakiensis]|uniref:SLBB domain-containing protein n=1 Tax=Pseudoalteromonas shioyasakiensis TaxID=1190813 RepID=UPI0021189CE3|nr:SLBB domain-containing protein [Pseudoalteromonas shioyasakiensis]MCQ8879449.1 SLBB domain-containing protein [Pseudoalteromonas shioyasakiensis]
MKLISAFFISIVLSTAAMAQSATPTSQQIAQFKKLPKAQQEALAKKYGLDMSMLNKSGQNSNELEDENTQSVLPRDPFSDQSENESLTEEEKFKPKEDELTPFGYELFSGEPTTFTPSENALVPDSYIVGPGDTLSVNLFGKETSTEEVTVDREGRLTISNLKPVTVAGMPYIDVVKLIKAKVEQEVIGTEVFVSMGKTRSIRVMVLGEAYKPGTYTVPSLSSITHALFASGGISDIGSLRNIQLKRAGKTVTTLDLYSLLIKGDSRNDVILKPGDVVFVPPVGLQVKVQGEVRRPAIFELKSKETSQDLIAMAGGFTAAAFPQKSVVERYTGNSSKTVLQLNLLNENAYNPKNGDTVKVPSSSKQLDNAVTLIGAVAHPGNYSWYEGKSVSQLFSSLKTDLLPIADYDYSLIIREKNVRGDIEVHQFSLVEAVQGNNDLVLQPRDKVVVFSRFQSIENEEIALGTMALTQEQLKLQEKIKLWGEYEERKFYEFIDLNKALDASLAETKEEAEKSAKSITELITQKEELGENDYAIFSRKKLLAPILAKLNQQANNDGGLQIIAVRGEVFFEGVYPRPVNGSVKDAIIAAGGLKESAYLESAEVTRLADNSSLEHLSMNISAALNAPKDNKFSLQSKDTINIYPIPNWQQDEKINIVGEVKFPGVYSIEKGEDLASVIKRAGGFTEFSFPEGAIFTRDAIRLQQQQQLNKISEDLRRDIAAKSFNSSITDSSLSYQDMSSLLSDIAQVKAVGRLVIDLPSIVNGERQLKVENKDVLYIPSKRTSISVVGEVNFSGSHLYDQGLDLDDYLARSGGLKQRADQDRIYIIKASGLVEIPETGSWFAVNDAAQLSPGDTIVVPLDTDYIDNLTLWSSATQILYQMGVAVAAIGSL